MGKRAITWKKDATRNEHYNSFRGNNTIRALLPNADRPYRCPGYPVIPALYVLLPGVILFYMVQTQYVEVIAGSCFVALGALVFYGFGLHRRRLGPLLDAAP